MHYTFGIIVPSTTLTIKVEHFQLDIVRIIKGVRKGIPHDLICKETNLLSLSEWHSLKFTKQLVITSEKYPLEYLKPILPDKTEQTRPNLRNAENVPTKM